MGNIIIGIHGLANKPEKDILEGYWKKAILEGLKKTTKFEPADLDFKLVYWADLLYKYPLHRDEDFDFDRSYNREPYVEAAEGALEEYKTRWLDKLRAGAFDVVGDALDYVKRKGVLEGFTDWLLGRILKDLAFYYDDEREIANRAEEKKLARTVLREELISNLKPEKGKRIMLIAHSMGSIIAYDALRDLGRIDKDFEVPWLVTIGSPLGLPHVKGKIIKERGYDPDVRTPSIVTENWVNYADKDDPVAIDIHLKDDYGENKHGVRVVDDLVANDYVRPGTDKNNAHKSYGYLRTPEISRHIKKFLKT